MSFLPSNFSAPFATIGAVKVKLYSLGMYAQDQWKATSKLNLTFALRLDRNSNPVCAQHCFSRLPGSFASTSHDVNTPYNATIRGGQSNAFSGVEAFAWSPRVGFAYSPDSKTVIRGGVGIFDDLFPATLVDRFITNAPNANTFTSGANSGAQVAALKWMAPLSAALHCPTAEVSVTLPVTTVMGGSVH